MSGPTRSTNPVSAKAGSAKPTAKADAPAKADATKAKTDPVKAKGDAAKTKAEPVNETTFAALGLPEPACAALTKRGITVPTPVQAAVIPLALGGGDLLAQARTGSGKTLAFLLPLASRVAAGEVSKAWIVLPTRELAQQVAKEAELLLGANCFALLVGGMPAGPQFRQLDANPPFVIGTPGRMVDHLTRGALVPDADILVLDEADQMLDLGFREDLERLVKDLGSEVARWCFSATFPPVVRAAVEQWLDEPRTVLLDTGAGSSHVPQKAVVAARGSELTTLARLLHLLEPQRALVFVRTREDVELVVRAIAAEGVEAAGISGDLTQEARTRVLDRFRGGKLTVLVGTDVAARGIDVPGVTHVFNLGLPQNAAAYTHRVGRTARAGADGEAWTVIGPADRFRLRRVAQIAGCNIEEVAPPTGVQLVAAKRQRLARRAEDALGEGLALPEPFATLATTHGADVVLAALVHRLVPDAPPEKAQRVERPTRGGYGDRDDGGDRGGPRQHGDHASVSRGGKVSLYVGLGRDDNANPGVLVAMLCRIPGVNGADLGRIGIFARHSLVECSPPVAEVLMSHRLHHRGRPIPVRPDRGHPGR